MSKERKENRDRLQQLVKALLVTLLLMGGSGCAGLFSGLSGDQNSQPAPYHVHTVQHSGETLGLISLWYTKNVGNWKAILAANPGLRPNRLRIGMEIQIPEPLIVRRGPLPEIRINRQPTAQPIPLAPVEETVPVEESLPLVAVDLEEGSYTVETESTVTESPLPEASLPELATVSLQSEPEVSLSHHEVSLATVDLQAETVELSQEVPSTDAMPVAAEAASEGDSLERELYLRELLEDY